MPAKSLSKPSVSPAPAAGTGRRIQTRRSAVHGNGVFAVAPIAAGERIIEYKGERISWKEALRRHPHDPAQPNHTFYFHIDDKCVIDANVGGNAARWINHACEPNCEADEQKGRIFIRALRDIAPGEELSYDYGLVIDEPYTPKLLADFPCWCGAETCRGTLLAPKDEDDDAPGAGGSETDKKKKKKKSKGKKDDKGGAKKDARKKDKKKDKKRDGKAKPASGKDAG